MSKNEYMEHLSSVCKNIKIRNTGLKITEDALILANVIRNSFLNDVKDEISGLEIGAGQGIISILLSEMKNVKRIDCVEIQKEVYDILVENIKMNNLEEKLNYVNCDIRNYEGIYDFVFSNPPYMKINRGKLPEDEKILISKYEVALTLEELIKNIKRVLKNYGIFFIIVPNNRLNDVLKNIYENKLNVLSLNIKKFKKTDLIVIVGKKGGKNTGEIKINIL